MPTMDTSSSPASDEKQPMKTAEEKIAAFDRIAGIIADQRKLEEHQRKHMQWEGIRLSRNDAYREIVLRVTGDKIMV
jgi:hypothetical protein